MIRLLICWVASSVLFATVWALSRRHIEPLHDPDDAEWKQLVDQYWASR